MPIISERFTCTQDIGLKTGTSGVRVKMENTGSSRTISGARKIMERFGFKTITFGDRKTMEDSGLKKDSFTGLVQMFLGSDNSLLCQQQNPDRPSLNRK